MRFRTDQGRFVTRASENYGLPRRGSADPGETQVALLSMMSAVALLYSVTWIVVPTFPLGKDACWSVGSAVLWGAAMHAVTVSIAAITPLNGFGMATCATMARARAQVGPQRT
jgi:hypothetical protein